MKESKNKKLVVKDNRLIDFKGRMSLNELKLFCLVVADVREQQENQFEEYRIDVSALAERTDFKDFYNYISEIALNLEKKRILLEGKDERGEYRTTVRLINKPTIRKDSKELELYIDKDLIPYILDLKKHFTTYEISNILSLNSAYSIRIYELLKQKQYRGCRNIKVDKLREYLGIKQGEYNRFYDFERWILKVAKEEINEYTDLKIDYEKIKRGRKIDEINFNIESKDCDKEIYIKYLNEFYNIKEMKLKMGLKEENFSPIQIMDIYEKAVKKAGNEDINLFEYIRLNYIEIKDKARNKYSYLLKALENDYASAIPQISLDYYIDK